jgi:hypothetical protein
MKISRNSIGAGSKLLSGLRRKKYKENHVDDAKSFADEIKGRDYADVAWVQTATDRLLYICGHVQRSCYVMMPVTYRLKQPTFTSYLVTKSPVFIINSKLELMEFNIWFYYWWHPMDHRPSVTRS